jgi:hypothetical protein
MLKLVLLTFIVAANIEGTNNQLINMMNMRQTHASIRTKRAAVSDHFFHSETDKILRNDSQFFLINKFKLPLKMDFDCKSKLLPIIVELKNQEGFEKDYAAFLESGEIMLKLDQENSDICRKMKTFALDNNHVMVVVNKHLDVVESQKVAATVTMNLLKDYEFLTLILYLSDIYDAEMDRIKYFVMLKVRNSSNYFILPSVIRIKLYITHKYFPNIMI